MKEQIKIRKQWLINPETQVSPSKKSKQKFKDDTPNLNRYTGFVDDEDLEELENELKDEEDRNNARTA